MQLEIDAGNQLNQNWCWAHVAAAVSVYHDKAKSSWTPAKLANTVLNPPVGIDCGTSLHSSVCDRRFLLVDALDNFTKNLKEKISGPADIKIIEEEILEKRSPVCVNIAWQAGSTRGHVLIIRGITKDFYGRDRLLITDPIFGDGAISHWELSKKYQNANGTWQETYLTKPST